MSIRALKVQVDLPYARRKVMVNSVCRILVGGVLLSSGIEKILHPIDFINVLSNYAVVPSSVTGVLLSCVVGVEFFLSLCMVLGVLFRAVSRTTLALFVFYTLFLLYSIMTGNTDHGCGCFVGGSAHGWGALLGGGAHITYQDVARDLALIGFTLTACMTYERRLGFDSMHVPKKSAQDLSGWLNERRRSQFFLLLSVSVIVSLGLAGMGQVTLAEANRVSMVNPTDYHPRGHAREVNTVAPNFRLSTDTGRSFSLRDYQGRVVLLEFFALWCPHCQAEAPIINQLDTLFPKSTFQTLSVISSPGSKDYATSGGTDMTPYSRLDIRWFESRFHLKNPILIDPQFRVTNQYLGQWYPTLYVIDPHGVIRNVFSSTTPKSVLLRAIRSAERQG